MKKIYYMMLLALVSMTMVSCHDWDTPYDTPTYVDDIVGAWVSEYGSDAYGEYDIRGYDVVRYEFYSNYTGNYYYYDYYGRYYSVGFDWQLMRGGRLFIRYYDGDSEYLYYGYDDYGYLILSTDSRFYQYTAYRPSGRYYESAKTIDGQQSGKVTGEASTDKASVKVKSISRAIKARDDAAQ